MDYYLLFNFSIRMYDANYNKCWAYIGQVLSNIYFTLWELGYRLYLIVQYIVLIGIFEQLQTNLKNEPIMK